MQPTSASRYEDIAFQRRRKWGEACGSKSIVARALFREFTDLANRESVQTLTLPSRAARWEGVVGLSAPHHCWRKSKSGLVSGPATGPIERTAANRPPSKPR